MTIGERLRAARERLRASLYQASRDTKIRVDYLQSMERDAFKFAAPTYVRGMVLAYARWLELDTVEIGAEFDRSVGAPQPISPTKIFREPAARAPRNPRSRWAIAAAVAAFTLLVFSFAGLVNPPETRVASPPAAPSKVRAQSETETTRTEPTARATQESAVAQAPPVVEKVQVALSITGDRCWMRVVLDGDNEHPVFSGTLTGGNTRTFEAKDSVQILFGNLGAVGVMHNGKDLGVLGKHGETKTLVFERESVRSLS